MHNRLVGLFIMVTASVALLFQQPLYAEPQVVNVTGVAPYSAGNDAKARDMAIQDAMRKAVEQAVGTMVTAETMVQDYQVIRDNVLTKTQGYIQKYDVISSGAKGNLYEVTISAAVAVENLKDDLAALGLLHARVEKPRVLFMIAEQNIGQEYIFWWRWWGDVKAVGQHVDMTASETALKEEFINKGFNIVDASAVTGKIEISNAYRMADLTDAGAKEIGRKLGAEVVIKGKAMAKEGPRTSGSNVGSYLADITASAVRVDTGAVLASARGHGVSRHISEVTGGTEALERAAKELSGKMIDQITAKWTQEVQAGGLIQITVRGIEEYSDLTGFKDAIKTQIRGINAIYQRSVESGAALIEVDYKGNAQQLADEIAKKKFADIPKLKVTGATTNTIEITFGGAIAPPAKATEAPSSSTAPAQQPVSESQSVSLFEADEYIVFDGAFPNVKWGYVGKMVTQPTKTNPEAEFLMYNNGSKKWGKFFKTIRRAAASELQLGATIYYYTHNEKEGVYYSPPDDKSEVRREQWYRDVVTDNSLINNRGIVILGGAKVDVSNTFVEKK